MIKVRCAACSKQATSACEQCKLQTYCSLDCYRAHRVTHARICRFLASVRETAIDFLLWKALNFDHASARTQQLEPRRERPAAAIERALKSLTREELLNAVVARAAELNTFPNETVLIAAITEEYAAIDPLSSIAADEKSQRRTAAGTVSPLTPFRAAVPSPSPSSPPPPPPPEVCIELKRTAAALEHALASQAAASLAYVSAPFGHTEIRMPIGGDLEVHKKLEPGQFTVMRRGRVRLQQPQTARTVVSGVFGPPHSAPALAVAARVTPHFVRVVAAVPSHGATHFLYEHLTDPWDARSAALRREAKCWRDNHIPEDRARVIALTTTPDFAGAVPHKVFLELCMHFAVCQFILGTRAAEAFPRADSPVRVRYSAGEDLVYRVADGGGGGGAVVIRTEDGEPVPVFARRPKKMMSCSGVAAAPAEFFPDADPVHAAEFVERLFTGGGGGGGSHSKSPPGAFLKEPLFDEYLRAQRKPSALQFLKRLRTKYENDHPEWFTSSSSSFYSPPTSLKK